MRVTAQAALHLAREVLAGRKKGHLVLVDLARYVVSLHDGKGDLEGALARLRDAGPTTVTASLTDEEVATHFPNVKLPELRRCRDCGLKTDGRQKCKVNGDLCRLPHLSEAPPPR